MPAARRSTLFGRHRAVVAATVATLVLSLLIGTTAVTLASVHRYWTLSGVTFEDGGTLTGTLVIADDGTLTDVDVTTAGGSSYYGTHNYNSDTDHVGPGTGTTWFIDRTGTLFFLKLVLPDTTGAHQGDSLAFPLSSSYECENCNPFRYINAGSIVAGDTVEAPTTTSLSSSHNPASVATTVTFTATVSSSRSTPNGTVTFRDTTTGTDICRNVPLNPSGVAACSTASLPIGTHAIRASYGGSSAFQVSRKFMRQTIEKAGTSVRVRATPQPSVHGQIVHLSAHVSTAVRRAGTPTGFVTFRARDVVVCTRVRLDSNGDATCNTAALSTGRNRVTATYSGDRTFSSSTSPVHLHDVNPAPTSTSVSATPAAIAQDQMVTLTATVTPQGRQSVTPSGKVQFFVDGLKAGSQVMLVNGQASLTIPAAMTHGSHHVRAFYIGGHNYVASSSPAAVLYVK